jgi:hypothetical protein
MSCGTPHKNMFSAACAQIKNDKNVLCKQGKRHQVCGGPCGVLVTREIKEEGSLGHVTV